MKIITQQNHTSPSPFPCIKILFHAYNSILYTPTPQNNMNFVSLYQYNTHSKVNLHLKPNTCHYTTKNTFFVAHWPHLVVNSCCLAVHQKFMCRIQISSFAKTPKIPNRRPTHLLHGKSINHVSNIHMLD